MKVPGRIADAASARILASELAIENTLQRIQEGSPLLAEPERARAVDRVCVLARVDRETAGKIVDGQNPATIGLRGEALARAEAIQGGSVDYVGVAWLDAGRLAASAVVRILFRDGSPHGTGFLVSPRLLLTNNHVVADKASARRMIVEFRYELPLGASSPSPIQFALDPDRFFETDDKDDLDYTLVAIGGPITPGATLHGLGNCPLSGSAAKHAVSEIVNIVQHPDGDYKQVVHRENRIVFRGETVLHYVADTEPGSSGSPVFNDQWQPVALHHWGGPHRELSLNGRPLSRDVNEGIRISAIVGELKARQPRMTESERALLAEALDAPPPSDFGTRRIGGDGGAGPQVIIGAARASVPTGLNGEGREGPPASRIDRKYSGRRGYNERFLPNFPVPLPQLSLAQQAVAARVRGVGAIANPFELKYEHFSVVLNGDRRMPFYSACNIDGAKRVRVDRDTGLAVSEPEATENWATDP